MCRPSVFNYSAPTLWSSSCNTPFYQTYNWLLHPLRPHQLYIGLGDSTQPLMPSRYVNAFCLTKPPQNALDQYHLLLLHRPDRLHFLAGLINFELICDCGDPHNCHSELLRVYASRVCSDLEQNREAYDLPSEIDQDDEHLLECHDEISFGQEPQGNLVWPDEWHELVNSARSVRTRAFWELFAGCAILTAFFTKDGWETIIPVDAATKPSYNVLNPTLLCITLGLISERLCAILHLGTPCSSFCKALNSDPNTAVRSIRCPLGLPNLSDTNQAKVDLDNALAHVSAILWSAQVAAAGKVQWELPSSSLVLWHKTAGPLLRAAYDSTAPFAGLGRRGRNTLQYVHHPRLYNP